MIPATCVPWPYPSNVVCEFGFTLTATTLPLRSGCDASTPLSMIATAIPEPVAGRPVARVQALDAPVSAGKVVSSLLGSSLCLDREPDLNAFGLGAALAVFADAPGMSWTTPSGDT